MNLYFCFLLENAAINIAKNEATINKLGNVLKTLNSEPYILGLLLEHQYASQSFLDKNLRSLKGSKNLFNYLLLSEMFFIYLIL